jgi:hypothetical protein
VTKRDATDEQTIRKSGEKLVDDVRKLIPRYNEDRNINTDQLSLEIELVWSRTLSVLGEKTTMVKARSKNESTHSYTVQPTISLSGKLIGPNICFSEREQRSNVSEFNCLSLCLTDFYANASCAYPNHTINIAYESDIRILLGVIESKKISLLLATLL